MPDRAIRDGASAICHDVAERGDEALAVAEELLPRLRAIPGLVVLRPDELPAVVDRGRYYAAIAALEEVGETGLVIGQTDPASGRRQTKRLGQRSKNSSASALDTLGSFSLRYDQ